MTTDATPLWTPPPDTLSNSRIGAFMRFVEQRHGLEFGGDYSLLWEWSVTALADFWRAVWDFFGVVAEVEPTEVLVPATGAGHRLSSATTGWMPGAPGWMPGARWFVGARLNYAENVLRMPGVAGDAPAVLAYSQTRAPVTLTAAELREQVRRVRAGLRRLGVAEGDRVAAYAPNIPEAYVLMLATASLGAIFTSCAPEFGARSVVDRWQQVEPVLLVAVDGYRYGDKEIDRTAEVAEIAAALPTVRHLVTLPYLRDRGVDGSGVEWATLAAETDEPLAVAQVPFDHPLYLLYSSGTTGPPKPIVHGHGGILLEHLKVLGLHHDLGPGDRFCWFSTTGWMMWNYLASAPTVGAAIVMFDGDPGWPDLGALWRLVDSAGITLLGTSAPFLLACRKANIAPREHADLSTLRGLGSTGAPLPEEGYRWVYANVSDTLQLQSISGGTDVCTGFVGAAPILPVHAGEIACRCLGARVEAYDAAGNPVIGEVGELVITAPMPSMPVGFWNDPDGARYRAAYFGVYPGVWHHGDWVTITPRGSCVISGRSDATLNRGGVRLGTSEFYSVVEGLPEVSDSLVVHLEDSEGDAGELLLFVVPADGVTVDDALRRKIAAALRTNLSPRHVPDRIEQVPAVPRTLSGKKLEVPVKRILLGTPASGAVAPGALANPSALEAFAPFIRC